MAFTEFERKRYEKLLNQFLERRQPLGFIRHKAHYRFRIVKQYVEIYEQQRAFLDAEQIIELAVAKAAYVSSRKLWKIYWARADMKWHRYEPHPEAKTLEEFLDVVDKDEYGCFFG